MRVEVHAQSERLFASGPDLPPLALQTTNSLLSPLGSHVEIGVEWIVRLCFNITRVTVKP